MDSDQNSKSFAASLASLAILTSALWLTVYLSLWTGFFIDSFSAKLMFVAFVVIPAITQAASSIFRWPLSKRRVYQYSAIVSLVICLGSIAATTVRNDNLHPWMLGWMIVSMIVLHRAFYIAATFRLIPKKIWARFHFRFAAHTLAFLSIAQVLAFCLIALYVASQPGRNRSGETRTSSAQLQNYDPKAPASPAPRDSTKLRVLSFNAWAVEGWIPQFIVAPSRDLEARLNVIPRAIANLAPDLVVFQEVWKFQTRLRLIEELRKLGYRYAVHGSASFMSWFGIGNGLLIVSRLPLDSNFESLTFTKSTRFDEGPTFARKGAIKTRVYVGSTTHPDRWVDLYAAHLGGFTTIEKNGTGDHFDDVEQVTMGEQAVELGSFIAKTSKSEALVLAADLNAHPFEFKDGRYLDRYSFVYRKLTCSGLQQKPFPGAEGCLDLVDSVAVLHPDKHSTMFTYDPENNFYARSGTFSYEPRGRIDYIFSKGATLKPISAEIVFTEVELSDHYGVLTVYELN